VISYEIHYEDDGLADRLRKFPQDRPEINRKILNQVGLVTVGEAQKNLRGGNPLNVVTARLWNSVTHRLAGQSVWVGTNVFYGRQHETGKTASGKQYILPRTKPLLYIPLNRNARRYRPGMVFGQDYVMAKQAKIMKRPWLKPAIDKVLADGAHVRIGSGVYQVYFERKGLR